MVSYRVDDIDMLRKEKKIKTTQAVKITPHIRLRKSKPL
jgi:hypothetical protein